MRRVAIALLVLACCLAHGAAAPAVGASGPDATEPRLVGVVPNPVADGDTGEFVVVDVPAGTNLSDYALGDGEERVRLPNVTVSGRVVLTAAPQLIRARIGTRVVGVSLPALSNGGERLRLFRENRTVSTLRYEDAPEGERWNDGAWQPVGATDYPVVEGGAGTARVFVLPDAPGAPVDPIRNATDRVWLAGYTLTSERVVRALVAANERGADVRVLLEGGPVGGITTRQANRLDTLTAAGVAVRVVTGPSTRYAYHHSKYLVADGRGVVLTENWKPAGTGGRSSRGWGAVVTDREVVAGLARTFEDDFAWRAATEWASYRTGRSFTVENASTGSFPTRFESDRVPYEHASVLVAPDNAESAITARLRAANDSVQVVQMTIGPDSGLLRATIAAARRGVSVRVLLSGTWYVREENAALAERLNGLAGREGLDLEARLATPFGYEKIHAKGVIVDETVLLGSLNWNEHAATENREVVLALSGADVANYYGRVFDADWRASGSVGAVPGGMIAALGVGALACLLVARRLEFE